MAIIVGTLLMAVNYGDKLWLDQLRPFDWLKIALTYLVPYSVSSYTGVDAFRRYHGKE